jgi:hypothetical protein
VVFVKRISVLVLALILALPMAVSAEKPASGQWAFDYAVMDQDFPCEGGIRDFHLVGGHFYFPVSQRVAIGPSFFLKVEAEWPKVDKQGRECDYMQGGLEVKISTFPTKFLNPFLILCVGAYRLEAEEWTADAFASEAGYNSLRNAPNNGIHAFAGLGLGMEMKLGQFVLGAKAQAYPFDKVRTEEEKILIETGINALYAAYTGFNFKL